jgi:hypothetical protein
MVGLPAVKADVHVLAYVNSAVATSTKTVQPLLKAALDELASDGREGWTLAGLEHFIWRVQSGRAPL